MKRLVARIGFLALVLALAGCGSDGIGGFAGSSKEPDALIIAQWNVQTLFDDHETGREYRDFLEAAGWTAEKYQSRIIALSQAVLQMAGTAPALIGFTEVESAAALEGLAKGELSKHGYRWTAFASIPGAPLGLGFLSRFPISDVRAHSITVEAVTAPRPVLEVRIEPGGKPLVFLLCHWKSKLGGDAATAPQRRASARVVQRRLGELAESRTPVIVMGDLNETHDEFHRHLGQVFCALLPDDPDAALLAAALSASESRRRNPEESAFPSGKPPEFLVLSGEKPPRAQAFPEGVHALYSPWGNEKTGGSYYFRDRWESIDHFLLSEGLFDGAGWDFADSSVLNQAPFTAPDGSPNSYNPRTGRGLSDHLPLLLYLRDLGDD